MFDRVLKRMRELIRTGWYVMTLHAEDEMSADDLTVWDVESAVLNGKIVQRQRDRGSREWKYLVRGSIHRRRSAGRSGKTRPHEESRFHYGLPSMKEKPMACDICGKRRTQIRHVSRTYGKGVNLFVIENVPIVSCPHCGESYLTAETLHEIERIKLHRRNLAKERRVAVASFV